MSDPARLHYIALNMMQGIGPVRVRALMDHFGSVEAIFEAGAGDLRGVPGMGPKLVSELVRQRSEIDPAAEEAQAHKLGAQILTRLDDSYPVHLREIHDPPLALYLLGTLEPRDKHALAVVGTRRCSHYGKQTADRLAFQLGKQGYCVISGLARGIDTAAHQGALKSGGRTLAVLGSALDCLYPTENAELAEQIAGQGAVLSEFPLGTQPGRTTFPMRNRIVSGMSAGVVVVEAAPGSGAILTADEGASQGRLIFAVPGRIDAPGARGCHRLIKSGAKLVEDVDDITEEFEYLIAPDPQGRSDPQHSKAPIQLSGDEQTLLELLVVERSMALDDLIRQSKLPSGSVGALLIALEMKRLIKMLPGRRVELALNAPSP